MEREFKGLGYIPEKNHDGFEFEKYMSLLHILKGQEEFLLNSSGIIISSNLEVVNITGYEEHEVLGKHISFFYPHDSQDKAERDLEKAIHVGQSFVTGLRVKKRGATFWAKMKFKCIYQGDPAVQYFKVILQDTTHRALSNLRVRNIKDEYLAIFNNPFVGTFKFRMGGYHVQACNMKTLEITGRKDSEDIRFDSFFNSAQQFEKFIDLLKREKKIEGFKFTIRDNGADDNWCIVSARYFENRGFVEGVIMDISEQHNQMIELQRVNAELDSFTYHASHDLRAPLATILGLVNLGVNEKEIHQIHSYLDLIKNRIDHLDVLLKDLTSVSYNNKAEIEYEVFDFNAEVKSIVEFLSVSNSPVNLELDIRQECAFLTDTVRLRTILRNLLCNAFRYYNPDVAEPFIRLKIGVNLQHAAIQVMDNGIGIEGDYKEKVYNMFFRATTRSTGCGLGLYIVKSMVEKLKGRISFESTINEGTTFLLTIPNKEKTRILNGPENGAQIKNEIHDTETS